MSHTSSASAEADRPRLLFLSHRVPYPPHNGAALRTYNILKLLQRDFAVTAVCFSRRDAATSSLPLAERLAALGPCDGAEAVPIPQEASRVRLVRDHVGSLLTGRPYTWFVHDDATFLARVRELLATQRFDVVHVDSLDLVRAMPLLASVPVVCTHHNVESELLRRRSGRERNPAMRRYLRLQGERLQDAEREWLPRVALNIAVSETDAAILRRLSPHSAVEVVPNGVDTDFFAPGPDGPREGCAFVGGTTWYPNRDALEWCVAEVLPRLRAMGIDAPITWIGRASEAERDRYRDVPGLQITGYVEDIRPLVHRAAAFIAPLRVGGGTRLKLLDAWALGKAVVSTSAAAEGLAAEDGRNILLADDADAFAAAIGRVLSDGTLRRHLEAEARRTAVERYAWEVIGARMLEMYGHIARPVRAADAHLPSPRRRTSRPVTR